MDAAGAALLAPGNPVFDEQAVFGAAGEARVEPLYHSLEEKRQAGDGIPHSSLYRAINFWSPVSRLRIQ